MKKQKKPTHLAADLLSENDYKELLLLASQPIGKDIVSDEEYLECTARWRSGQPTGSPEADNKKAG